MNKNDIIKNISNVLFFLGIIILLTGTVFLVSENFGPIAGLTLIGVWFIFLAFLAEGFRSYVKNEL
jgi:hypothetical protein